MRVPILACVIEERGYRRENLYLNVDSRMQTDLAFKNAMTPARLEDRKFLTRKRRCERQWGPSGKDECHFRKQVSIVRSSLRSLATRGFFRMLQVLVSKSLLLQHIYKMICSWREAITGGQLIGCLLRSIGDRILQFSRSCRAVSLCIDCGLSADC